MTNRKTFVLAASLFLLSNIVSPVAAVGQISAYPPIIIGLSINESGSPIAYQGWPLLANIIVMNKNSFQGNSPINLSPAWKNSVHFKITNSNGNIVTWPFHLVATTDVSPKLDSTTYAQIGFWLEPTETNFIPADQYEITAILDSTAYGSLGGNFFSVLSNPTTIRIFAPAGSLDTQQKTERDLLFANLNILKADESKALNYLSGILGYNATDGRTLALTGSILESQGDFEGALYAYSKGIDAFYKANPSSQEPPVELLTSQRALYYKMDNAASFIITLTTKDSAHPAYNRGSLFTYSADNVPARELEFVRGQTYTFISKNIPSTDPLYFTTNPKGGGPEPYTDGVSGTPVQDNGTATIAVRNTAPDVLYYQSTKNEYVGWRINISDGANVTAVTDTGSAIPRKYSLSCAYPNPFNPSTRIRYTLAKPAYVHLTVYDIIGREVAQLVDEKKEAGTYQVEWNPQLPSGIYFYTIKAGEFSDTKKMILLR